MAAQVRGIIERADMLNYQPNTLITAVEWPLGWGEAIKPACAELGLNTLAEVHEASKHEQGLRDLSRRIAATAKINYLVDLARKVCGRLTEAEKKRQKFNEPPAEQKAAWAKQREAERQAADDEKERDALARAGAGPGSAPRMTRPEGMRAGRVIATYNTMDKALKLMHAGCTPGQVARELRIEEHKLYKWAKKYPEFAELSGLDIGSRKRGRKSARKQEPRGEAPVADNVVGKAYESVDELAEDVAPDAQEALANLNSMTDDEPFPPFPEDEPTEYDARAADYHTRPTDKIEKPQIRMLDLRKTGAESEPAALDELATQVYAMADGQAEAYTKLNDRVTDMRGAIKVLGDTLHGAIEELAQKYQSLFEETGRIGEHVAEALGKLWVGDATTDPFIRGLVQHLPSPGAAWSLEDRRRWIHCAETVFSLMYKLPEQAAKPAEELETAGPPPDPRAISSVDAQAKRTARRKGKAPSKKRAASQPAGLIRRARQPIAAA